MFYLSDNSELHFGFVNVEITADEAAELGSVVEALQTLGYSK